MASKPSQIRNKILSTPVRMLAVSVPEWGFESGLFVKALSIREAVDFEKRNEAVGETQTVALYLCFALCDGEARPVFTAEDMDVLYEKEYATLMRLFDLAARVNKGEDSPGKS